MPPSFPRGCPHLPHSGCVSAGNRWQALEDDSCLRTKTYWHMGITDWNGFSAICHWRGKLGWFNSTNLISSFYCLFSTCRETVFLLYFFLYYFFMEYSFHAITSLYVISIQHLEVYAQKWWFQNTFFNFSMLIHNTCIREIQTDHYDVNS